MKTRDDKHPRPRLCIRVGSDPRVFAGETALDVINDMRSANAFAAEHSPAAYMQALARDARKWFGVELPPVDSGPDAKRADILIGALLHTGLAKEVTPCAA